MTPEIVTIDELPVEPEGERAWDAYVDAHPDASVYHRAVYRRIVSEGTGNQSVYFRASVSGRLVGVLPIVHLKSVLFGSSLVSLPYFNHCGVLADDHAARDALLQAAVERAMFLGVSHIELRQFGPSEGLTWPGKTHKVEMILDLPDSVDALFRGFTAKLRAQIRRPGKACIYARLGGLELLDDFYAVFAQNMRDLGTPVYGQGFFRAFMLRQPESTRLCVCYRSGKPVAGGLVVGHRDVLEIPWASTLRAENHDSPNMLLYARLLEFAVESGYRRFDFGRSTPHEGTFAFKQQWGARPSPLHWYYWLKPGTALPEQNPKNPKHRLAIRTWQKLPLSLTRLVGPHLVKHLP